MPLPFSKTDEACDCSWLQRMAENPNIPVEFDDTTHEFNIVCEVGTFAIYHCPFCGGKAPESKRASFFTHISSEEQVRLRRLTAPLKTLSQVLEAFGQPDEDHEFGTGFEWPEREGRPPVAEWRRALVYKGLSDTADVRVTTYPDDRVGFAYLGKYIGPPRDDKS
jgi:hypothetical protein